MSYDMFIWAGPPAANSDEVEALMEDACEGEGASLTPNPALGRFLADLFAEYPSLESAESDASVASGTNPWSFTDDTSDRHALLSLSPGGDDQAFRRIVSLSKKHRLNCFDPQSGEIYNRA